MRGSENAFNTLGARLNTGRRKLTVSRGGIAPELNQGVTSLLPFVLEEEQNKRGAKVAGTNNKLLQTTTITTTTITNNNYYKQQLLQTTITGTPLC